jgi:hypothetical protein
MTQAIRSKDLPKIKNALERFLERFDSEFVHNSEEPK